MAYYTTTQTNHQPHYARRGSVYQLTSVYAFTHHTMPWAPEPMGFRFWYRLRIVNFVSPTSTV